MAVAEVASAKAPARRAQVPRKTGRERLDNQGMTITTRPATLADVPAIRDVLVTTWHATYDRIDGPEAVTRITDVWHAVEVLHRQVDQPGSCFLLAETNTGQVVATSLAVLLPDDTTIALSRLYILPTYQRGGLGTRLLRETLTAFGAKLVTLEVAPENTQAIAFYVRHGFTRVADTQNCGNPDSGIAALIYHKVL
jgi:ribosomal protein S18 acetylase RimI-like enzyme